MDPVYLRRVYSSIAGQKEALEGLRDPARREIISAAGAVAFGAVPVAEAGGRLVLATAGAVHPDCRGALASALGREVELVRFEEGLVREAVDRHYLRKGGTAHGPDLRTFQSPAFLRDAGSARSLLTEKENRLPAARVRTPRGRAAFLDLRLHSVLRSLDRKRRVEFAPAPSALPFRLARGEDGEAEAVLFGEKEPAGDMKAMMSLAVFYDGDDHLQAVLGQELDRLPHVLHPTELQIAGIEGDAARFFVYDSLRTVIAGVPSAGAPVGWSCRYYFLHYGWRLERTMRVDVLAFELVLRKRIRLAGEGEKPGPEDLERLFGLDFPAVGAAGKSPP